MWGYLKRKKWREKRGTCPTTSLSIQSFCCLKWSWRNNSRTYPLRNERWWILRTSIYDLRLWYTAHFASLLYYCRLIECVILQHICWVKVRPPYSHQSLSNLMVATKSCHTAHSSRSMRWKPLLFPYSHLAHYVHQHMCLLTSVAP